MAKIREMTRKEIMEELANDFIWKFTDTDELDKFVKNVLLYGWEDAPFTKMTDKELLAEWDKEINFDGEIPITIVEKV